MKKVLTVALLCVAASWTVCRAATQRPSAFVDIDPRGPVPNARMRPVAEADGVQVHGYSFHNTGPKPGPWVGQWIWLPPSTDGSRATRPVAALFRKEITLTETPSTVRAWLTADARYLLYVNGRLASRGPADRGRDYTPTTTRKWMYDVRDLTPLFKRGRNLIAVEVYSGEVPGLLFEAELAFPGGRTQVVASDASWRTIPAPHLQYADWKPLPAFGGSPARTLQFDARREPVGWRSLDYDDATWAASALTSAEREPLVASEIPPCMEARYPVLGVTRATPGVRLPAKPFRDGKPVIVETDGGFAVRFDRVMAAYYGIKVRGGAGATVALEASERNAPGHNRIATLVLRDGLQYFESPGYGSVGTINVTITGVTSPVEVLDVSAVSTSQPVEYRGSFACSDEKLNRIWKSCRWATQICMQTHHLDSPDHQEPICDYGDYLIEDRVNYYAFGEPWLARQDLRKWARVMQNANYQTFHTSYTLLWLQTLLDYYDFTGDLALVQELAPNVHALLDRFTTYRGKNGLLSEAPNYMFMDWVDISGFGCHHPPAVIGQGYLTAFYYRALADACRVAQLTGESQRVDRYRALRGEVLAAYNRELWSPEKGLYRDGKPFQTHVPPGQWLPADRDIETFSAQNNVLAVLYDLAPHDRQPAIIDRVLAQKPWNVRPYYMHFVLDAVAHAGRFDRYGAEWMRKWRLVNETQTFYEMGEGGGDLSHGWVATPLIQMSSRVLGIAPTGPGFKTLEIRPTLCDLEWAAGAVPTPCGSVRVRWQRKGDGLSLRVSIPSGTSADVAFPVGTSGSGTVALDGKALWKAGEGAQDIAGTRAVWRDGDALVVRVPAGAHTFEGRDLGLSLPGERAEASGATRTPIVTTPRLGDESAAALEGDVVSDSLVRVGRDSCIGADEEAVTHMGGGGNADAIRNGTTHNGSGGPETKDDGRTFRGYGTGSMLTFRLNTRTHPRGYDLSRIVTFAGHADARASQNYTVLVAFAGDPARFVPLTAASISAVGGASELRLSPREGSILDNGSGCRATGVAAVRFEFKDGSVEAGGGPGFNVYREICVAGKPTGGGK